MKFTDVETVVVGNPPPGYGGRYFVFVKLSTDTGATGWGEVYSPPFSPDTVAALVADVFDRRVKGTDPFRIEERTRLLYSLGFTQRPDVTIGGIISAFDMASWDIVGKETNRNVTDLLGGIVRERVRGYTYIYPSPGADDSVYTDPDLAAERAVDYVEAGHTAIKFDPAGPYRAVGPRQPSMNELDRSEAFMRQIREAVGTRADLLFGTHGQFTPSGAIRLAQRLEPWSPLWFEEPCPPDIPEAMADVARHTSIPVATGERLTSIVEFQRLLVTGSASILQPNLARAGGITAGKKIAAIAETFGAQVAPHLYCGPIAGAANLAVAATIPNFLVLEGIEQWGGFHAELLTNPVQWDSGYVVPFTKPGLGTEIDEAVAKANPWTGDGLHLSVTTDVDDWPG